MQSCAQTCGRVYACSCCHRHCFSSRRALRVGATLYKSLLTFFLSRMEPFPLTITLQPVSCSSCLAVSPRGPRIRPTKLN